MEVFRVRAPYFYPIQWECILFAVSVQCNYVAVPETFSGGNKQFSSKKDSKAERQGKRGRYEQQSCTPMTSIDYGWPFFHSMA